MENEKPGGPEGAETLSAELHVAASRPRSLLNNASWNTATMVWAIVVAFFMAPFLIGKLGVAVYGFYALLFVISGIMDVMNLGLAEATLRYVAHYYGRNDLAGINRILGATLAVYALTAVLGWAAVFFGAPFIAGMLRIEPDYERMAVLAIRITAFNFGLSFVSGVFMAIPQAIRRYDVSSWVRIGQSVCYVAGTVVVIELGGGLPALMGWNVVTSLLTLAASVILAHRLIPGLHARPAPTREGLREVFSYGVFSFVNQVLSIVWRHSDRALLGILISAESVAYLTVPQNLVFGAIGLASTGGHVLFPRFSAITSVEERRRLYVAATWVLLCVTVVIFAPLTVVIPDLLRLWISPEFAAKGAWVGQLLAGSCIVRGAFVPYEHLFRGMGKPQYLSRLILASSGIALASNAILIPKYGLAGAGYAFCLTPLCGLVTILVAWFRVLKMREPGRLVRTVLMPMVIGFAGVFLFSWARVAFFGEIGWASLVLLSGLCAVVMAGALLGCETLFGRRDSQARLGLEYLTSLRRQGKEA